MSDVYAVQFEGLVTIHRAIDAALQSVVDAATEPLVVLVQRTRGAAGFLLAHHDAESDVLFPALRRYGRLRSTDVSALDARDREHRDLHELCDRLANAAGRTAPDAAYIAALAAETRDRLRAHVAEEELTLSADRFREMVTLDELAAINRELEAFREKAQARLARLAG
jgi:hemerythrin-like domain-containing protein